MKYFAAGCVLFLSLFAYYFVNYQDVDFTLQFYEKFGPEPCSVVGGKVVWITGASSGIGEHLAYELASCGCKLVLSARRREKLEKVKDKCAGIAMEKHSSYDKQNDILVVPLDVKQFSTHVELTSVVINHFGKIDVLVNNAGVAQVHNIEETPFEVEKTLLDVNLLGAISLTKAVLPHMLKRKRGQFVVVSSVFGKYGARFVGAYSAGKFALQGYFNSLRLETLNSNLKVVTVFPGLAASEVFLSALTKEINVTARDSPLYSSQMKGVGAYFNLMKTERCAYLMSVAMANDLREVWMSNHPHLVWTYISQYMPSFSYWLSENNFPWSRVR